MCCPVTKAPTGRNGAPQRVLQENVTPVTETGVGVGEDLGEGRQHDHRIDLGDRVPAKSIVADGDERDGVCAFFAVLIGIEVIGGEFPVS